jgi:hypothetical protein
MDGRDGVAKFVRAAGWAKPRARAITMWRLDPGAAKALAGDGESRPILVGPAAIR